MDYTLANVAEKMRQFCDKMGSDYFPVPVMLNFFETASIDFIMENLKIIEKTQEITENIRPLIKTSSLPCLVDSGDLSRYIAALPTDYLRLVAYDVLYEDGTKCRRADLIKNGEKIMAVLDPNREPTKHYPLITQEGSLWHIDCGDAVPNIFKLTYCKKPTYATTGDQSVRIINLNDEAIEVILLKTTKLLFNKTADERSQSSYQLERTFSKVFA